jgi:hypothetical protein
VDSRPPSQGALIAVLSLAAVLLAGAVYVRGIRGEVPALPEDRERAPDMIAQPLQFLGRGAHLRLDELGEQLGGLGGTGASWSAVHRIPFDLAGCPKLTDWISTAEGQQVEQLLADLRRGSREEALGALTLLFELSRKTAWAPGVRGSKNAERLAALYQEWLRRWAEPAADDQLLAEPALACALVYARIMRLAYEAPPLMRDQAIAARARTFLNTLTGASQPRLSSFGEALEARYPNAFETFRRESDLLEGFAHEAFVLFPELDGECEE